MLPSLFSTHVQCSRGKRSNCIAVPRPIDSAKRLALEIGKDSLAFSHGNGEPEGGGIQEERSCGLALGGRPPRSNCSREGLPLPKRHQQHSGDSAVAQGTWGAYSSAVSTTPPKARTRPVERALQISRMRRLAKMEGSRQSQRTPEEVELALEVLNDELAGASPLDRPSLELATQALTDRLVELRKQQRESRNPADAAETNKQSTHEYSSSLQAVILGDGRQKYTLIKIPKQDDMRGDIYLVRGDPKAEYHYQTALDTLNALQSRNILSGNCVHVL